MDLKQVWEDWELDGEGYISGIDQALDEKIPELEEALSKSLVISLFGNVNAGKSSLLNKITGIKYTDISPIPGWTKHVNLYPFPGFKNVKIADTPGLEDITEEVAERAEEFVQKDSDIVLFVLNATVGITRAEKQAFDSLRSQEYPLVVVLNKIDLLKPKDRDILIPDLKEKLNLGEEIPFCATSAETGEGIDELIMIISEILETVGKDLLFAKIVREKDKIVDKWIWGAILSAAAIGAIPIPGSDIIPLTILQTGLIIKIAHVYGVKISKGDARLFISQVIVGGTGKTIFRQLVKGIALLFPPGAVAVAVIAAGVAGAMTYALGKVAKAYFKSGERIPVPELQRIYEEAKREKVLLESLKQKADKLPSVKRGGDV